MRNTFCVLSEAFLPSDNIVATLAVFFFHHRGQPSASRERFVTINCTRCPAASIIDSTSVFLLPSQRFGLGVLRRALHVQKADVDSLVQGSGDAIEHVQ